MGKICHLFGDEQNVGKLPRREYTKTVGKLKKPVEKRGEFEGTGL